MKKICIVMQNQYSKLGHALALHLKERYGVERFSAYVFSPGAADFLRQQNDIRYAPMLVDHELHARMTDTPIDREYIAYFEKTYGPDAGGPNVWQYLWCDRKLMMSIGPKEETTATLDPLLGHDDLMRAFVVRAKAIEAMLKEEKPDAIFFFAIGVLGQRIIYHVAKKLGIQTFDIDFPRIGNRVCVSEDFRTLSTVEQTAKQFLETNAQTPHHDEATALMKRFRETGSLDLQYMQINMEQMPKKGGLLEPQRMARSLRYLFTLFNNYHSHRGLFLYSATDEHPLRFIGHKLKQRWRMLRGIEDLSSAPNWDEPFIYYPLHYEPELAILLLSPFYFDQIELIKYIARSAPLDYKIYVKEHPAMVSRRARRYYQELLKIPNVRLIHHTTSNVEIMKHMKLLTTITGTAGWEASLVGKPVITFGDVFYNALSFVKRVRNIETLPTVMREQLFNFRYNEQEMRHFLAAVLQESVAFDFSRLWFENDIHILKENKGLQAFCKLLINKARS